MTVVQTADIHPNSPTPGVSSPGLPMPSAGPLADTNGMSLPGAASFLSLLSNPPDAPSGGPNNGVIPGGAAPRRPDPIDTPEDSYNPSFAALAGLSLTPNPVNAPYDFTLSAAAGNLFGLDTQVRIIDFGASSSPLADQQKSYEAQQLYGTHRGSGSTSYGGVNGSGSGEPSTGAAAHTDGAAPGGSDGIAGDAYGSGASPNGVAKQGGAGIASSDSKSGTSKDTVGTNSRWASDAGTSVSNASEKSTKSVNSRDKPETSSEESQKSNGNAIRSTRSNGTADASKNAGGDGAAAAESGTKSASDSGKSGSAAASRSSAARDGGSAGAASSSGANGTNGRTVATDGRAPDGARSTATDGSAANGGPGNGGSANGAAANGAAANGAAANSSVHGDAATKPGANHPHDDGSANQANAGQQDAQLVRASVGLAAAARASVAGSDGSSGAANGSRGSIAKGLREISGIAEPGTDAARIAAERHAAAALRQGNAGSGNSDGDPGNNSSLADLKHSGGAAAGLSSSIGAQTQGADGRFADQLQAAFRGPQGGLSGVPVPTLARGDASALAAQLGRQLQDTGNADIVREAKIILKNHDSGEIRMNLKPESLGTVRITLQIQNNHIAGRIVVDNSSVRDAFQQNLQNLYQAFRDSGFDPGALDVTVGQGNSNGGQNSQNRDRGVAARVAAAQELSRSVPSAAVSAYAQNAVNLMA